MTPRVKSLMTAGLLVFAAATVGVAVRDEVRRQDGEARSVSPPATTPTATKLIVYYFHTTTRCASCYKIETLTQFSLESDFVAELAGGAIEWRPVNIDTPGNGHFAKDYALYTKSVVLSAVRDGHELKWRNLDRVWHLLDDPKGFQEYIGEEVRTFRSPS